MPYTKSHDKTRKSKHQRQLAPSQWAQRQKNTQNWINFYFFFTLVLVIKAGHFHQVSWSVLVELNTSITLKLLHPHLQIRRERVAHFLIRHENTLQNKAQSFKCLKLGNWCSTLSIPSPKPVVDHSCSIDGDTDMPGFYQVIFLITHKQLTQDTSLLIPLSMWLNILTKNKIRLPQQSPLFSEQRSALKRRMGRLL